MSLKLWCVCAILKKKTSTTITIIWTLHKVINRKKIKHEDKQ